MYKNQEYHSPYSQPPYLHARGPIDPDPDGVIRLGFTQLYLSPADPWSDLVCLSIEILACLVPGSPRAELEEIKDHNLRPKVG